MKVNVYVIDFEIPARIKKWGLRIGIPAAALLVGGVAFAGLPGGYADGQPLTKAILDDNFNYLQSEIAMLQGQVHNPSAFRAELTTGPSVPSSTTSKVTFDSVVFDLAGEYSSTTGTFTPKSAGTYLITCSIFYCAVDVDGAQYSAVLGYGTTSEGTDLLAAIGSAPLGCIRPEVVSIRQLNAGAAITCGAYQNSGGAATLGTASDHNVFSATRLY
jgi:hypothetical protein